MKSNKYIRIFFMLLIQNSLCSQGDSIYQPKTYNSISSVQGKTLYPGDTVVCTYTEVLGANGPATPGKDTLLNTQIPMFDARYFVQQQVSAVYRNSTQDPRGLEGVITLQYKVKNISTSTKTVIFETGLPEASGGGAFAVGTTVNSSGHSQYGICTIAPSSDASKGTSEYQLPNFVGTVYTEQTLKGAKLYPGDVIKIENFTTAEYEVSASPGEEPLSYEYILMPYRDMFEVYQDPTVQSVPGAANGRQTNKYQTTLYFVVKENNLNQTISFDYARFAYYGGPLAQGTSFGYARVESIVPVSLAIAPSFFSLINNSDLRRVICGYLGTKDGCTSNAQDADKRTPLMWSIFYGQEDLVKHFLSDPVVSLVVKDKDARTALLYAAQRNNAEIARLLLAKDSASQALPLIDKDGMNMLHYAVWNSNYTMAQSILAVKSLKSIVNDANAHGVTPLMYAAAQGNKKLAQLLLDNKADYALVDKNGFDCLFYACMSLNVDFVKYLYGYILADDKEIAQTMLHAVAVDQTNLLYNTLLVGKSDADFYEMVQFLLGQGLSPESGYDGSKQAQLQPYLQAPAMQRGAYASILALACSKGTAAQKTIQLLLQQGAVVTSAVLAVAQTSGVSTLLNAYTQQAGPALYQALYKGDTTTALRIAQQFDPSLPAATTIANYTNSGWSVLFLLAAQAQGSTMQAYNAVASELIKRGANVNIVGPDQQGNPVMPLVWAVNNGNAALQTLLQTNKATLSHTVANTIAIDSSAAEIAAPLTKTVQKQPSGLISGNVTQMSGFAVPETIEVYDSVEYLLG